MPARRSLRIRSRRFYLRWQKRVRILRNRIYHGLGMKYWFPHLPLALAVGVAGAAQLLSSLGSLQSLLELPHKQLQELNHLTGGYKMLAIHGIPTEVVGTLLLLMSIGLLFRSRLGWVLTILATLGSLALELWPPSTHHDLAYIFYNGLLLLALFIARGSFNRASLATGTLFALVGILLTLGYGVLGTYALGNQFAPPVTDFITALYFTVVTASTVGYGDITPHTTEARIFTISLIVLGLAVFATALTAIMGPVINDRMMRLLQPPKKKHPRRNHIIVVGDSALARNTIFSLKKVALPVTVILPHKPVEDRDPTLDRVIGDGTDTAVLQEAGIDHARGLLALTDNDSDNAFVILAAKDVNPNIRTVASVNDAHNIQRIRRVRPDVVLALPVLGAELVAMALANQEIHIDTLLDQLQKLK